MRTVPSHHEETFMKSTRNLWIVCFIVAAIAGSAFAQLLAENRDWAKGPVQFLMTEDETARWKQVKTDAEAKSFIDLFWARRDPTPGTPANEFRADFDQRVEYADRQFAQGRKKGSLTERGRIFITLGPPFKVTRTNPGGQGTIQSPATPPSVEGGIQSYSPRQIWTYDQVKTTVDLGQPIAEIAFIDQYASNDWTLERTARTNVDDLVKRTVRSYIVSADLTEAPSAQAPAPAAQQLSAPTTPAPAAEIGAFTTASLRAAVDEFKALATNPYKDKVFVTYTEFVSPTGEYFVPVQLYIPKSANLTADSVTTFFGVIEDDAGNRVAVFEEPATLSSSKGDLYFDKSLTLKPGKYRATLGLSNAEGKPVVLSSSSLELRELTKETSGISRMVLAADVHQTETAAFAGAPYAFGQLKIVPKGDQVFTNKDEITYFVELLNPAIDEATKAPKIQVGLELEGKAVAGKPARKIKAPITEATPLPLTGTPGVGPFAIIASIPLSEMKTPLAAGDYTLRLKVFDTVSQKNWTAEKSFRIVAAQ